MNTLYEKGYALFRILIYKPQRFLPETVHKHLMSTLGTRATIAGAILCVLGLSLFAYGMGSMSYANAVSNSYIVIIAIFIGMAGMLILMMDLYAHMH